MSDEMTPYSAWLGIETGARAPDHYCLLGLSRFEPNLQRLRDAGERQRARIRVHLDGPHATVARRVLAEIETALACLCDAAARRDYDRQLREHLGRKVWADSPAAPAPVAVCRVVPQPVSIKSAASQPSDMPLLQRDMFDDLLVHTPTAQPVGVPQPGWFRRCYRELTAGSVRAVSAVAVISIVLGLIAILVGLSASARGASV